MAHLLDYDPSRCQELTLGDQRIRYDRVATAAQYAAIPRSGSEECACTDCRNFAAQTEPRYSSVFLTLLQTLGIDPGKEGEAYRLCTQPDGRQFYGGWFFFCGQIIDPGKGRVTGVDVDYWVEGPGKMPAPGSAFGGKPLALEFQTTVPWVLTDVRPDY